MNRKVITFILVLLLVITFAGIANCEMSQTEKYERYQTEKKTPWIGVLGAAFFPSVGHLYAGNWLRGVPFAIVDFIGISMMYSALTPVDGGYVLYEENAGQARAGALLYLVSVTWEMFDAYWAVEDYNKGVMKKYGLDVVLREHAPVLQLSYWF